MKVTIIAIGSRGDVEPYVALAAGLRRAGHDVRLATHQRFAGLVEGLGVELAVVAEGDLSRGTQTDEGRRWLERELRLLPNWAGLLKDAASVAERRLADCRDASEDADVLVVSVLATLLGRQLSDALGVPLVRAYYAPPGRERRVLARQVAWTAARPWVNRARRNVLGASPLPLREPIGTLDRRGVPVLYGFSREVVPDFSPASHEKITGYWRLAVPDGWTPPPALERFLAAGDAPVLITFSAMAERQPVQTTRLLLDALTRAGRRGLILRGPSLDPGADLGTDVMALDAVPFAWLFPRVAAVVHHGGAGTTASALHAGVPSVVVPFFADQPFWAARVAALGVGTPPLPRKGLTAEELADAIRTATTDEAMLRRAGALATRLATEDGVATAVAAIDARAPTEVDRIAARPRPRCPMCGTAGTPRYRGVRDRIYAAPGNWSVARCPNAACHTHWLDPVPSEADIGKAYRTYYTHHAPTPPPRVRRIVGLLEAARRVYLQRRFGYPAPTGSPLASPVSLLLSTLPGGRDALEDTACHLPASAAGARLLEVGFGNGLQLRRMRELGWEVTGVDVDPAGVAAARDSGLDVRLGDLADQSLPEGTFDAIYSSHVIEHVHEPESLLRECHRVLKPGGVLVAVTPNVRSWGHRVFGENWFLLEPPRHLVIVSPEALRAAARRAGFGVAETRTSVRIAFITWIGSRDIRIDGRVTSFLGAKTGPVPLGRLLRSPFGHVGEALLLRRRPDAGEEIILIARRTAPVPTMPSGQTDGMVGSADRLHVEVKR
jgi:sterol 3beta-glucosyltransferase